MQTYPYTDLNECASNSTNTCHEDAECHDTEGSYWCECGPGFTGDGYNCTGTTVYYVSPTKDTTDRKKYFSVPAQ